MSRSVEARLRRLEQADKPGRQVVVVQGWSKAQHERQLAELAAAGRIDRTRDLIVCLRLFGGDNDDPCDGPVSPPKIYYAR